MSWSKNRRHSYQKRQSWAEEVIAAAMMTTSGHVSFDVIPDEDLNEDDEGIVSDESPPSSNNEELYNSEKCLDATSRHHRPKEEIMAKHQKSKSTMYLNEDHLRPTSNPHQGNIVRFLRSLVVSKSSGKNQKSRVFGKDLKQHLTEIKQEIPPILRVCAKSIEHRGIVDGIYRLSGISSNIRALKAAFETSVANNRRYEEKDVDVIFPIEVADPNIRQDVHSVSSLLKLYFRELPDPVCTYKLYDQFLEAARVPEDLRLSAMRQVVNALPKENFKTMEYLMRHLHKVSQKGQDTGMTAKNLAIVWAPNLLRSKDIHTKTNNLKDIAMQAVCTEFLIKYWSLLFASTLPTISLDKSFELGIIESENTSREIDIDTEIDRRNTKTRPKSMAADTHVSIIGGNSRMSASNNNVVQLKRSTSSILNSPAKKEFNLSRFLVTKPKKQDGSEIAVGVKSEELLPSDDLSEKTTDPDDSNTDTTEHSAGLKSDTKHNKTEHCAGLKSEKNTAEPDHQRRPYSSSSEGSETDVAGEVDHLHLSFEQEENEMKMMNCICDEDEEEDQISSESTPDSSPSPIENGSKVKSSSRFLKSRPVKVQRSASSILRNKMYQVIKKKKKPKGTIAENNTDEKVANSTEESILKGVTFENIDHSNKPMAAIQEELSLAFDNQAYLSLNLDSGFDSSPSSYENVPVQSSLVNDVDADSDPSYENIDEEDILSYENIEPPLLYQCKQTADSSSLGAASDEPIDAYENLKFQKTAAHPDVSVISLNKTITPDPIASTATVTTKTVQVTTNIPVYATCKKVSKTELEDCPVYENYDFQEQAIYQNMMVSPKGRMIPAKNVKSNDVYAQVKFLRMSVQEVNAIIEEEVPNLSKRSELVMQRAKQLDDQSKTSHFSRTANTGSVKRSSNFKNILYKFNVMSSNQTQQHSSNSNPPQDKQKRKT